MGTGNSIFYFIFQEFFFFLLWNKMHLDRYYYCLFIAESSGRKENELKSPRSFLMRITSHVLNWTFSFLYFVTKSNSNIFSFEMLALLSYSDFLFSPCPSFRRGSAEWQYFDPDHPFWVLPRLPKPLTACSSWPWPVGIPALRDENVIIKQGIYLCNSPEGSFRQGSWKSKLGFLIVDA